MLTDDLYREFLDAFHVFWTCVKEVAIFGSGVTKSTFLLTGACLKSFLSQLIGLRFCYVLG